MAATKRVFMNLSGLDLLGFSGRVGGWFDGSVDKFVNTIHKWNHRHRTRRELLEMEDYILKDIGINRIDAIKEGKKTFWEG